ncbi:hypothetical protein AY599_22385 [Leptolyngbya valderiana BDU 20041]|nr:hypothetical protein AY599_22385 [Leptolyngbya valderiana BDU 20041]
MKTSIGVRFSTIKLSRILKNSALLILLSSTPTVGQIVPDSTLANPSQVSIEGNTYTLDGGTAAGNNLFHSFDSFSVPTGTEAFFNNAADVQNILTRVTGRNISNIDGLIRANGTANLFLLNPNGIVFGPNARLDIGGSFLGTTAESVLFEGGEVYSATQPSQTSLLTVTVPVGLQLGTNTGDIQVNGAGHGFTTQDTPLSDILRANGFPFPGQRLRRTDRNVGLEVQSGRTLALLGGNVDLPGGILTAESGRVEVGAVENGIVTLNSAPAGWQFNYEGVEGFRDVRFSQAATADASGSGAGIVRIAGRDIAFTDGSLALIQTTGPQSGGILSVRASGSIEAIGSTSDPLRTVVSGMESQTIAQGSAASVEVFASRLVVRDGARLGSRTYSEGNAGSVRVTVTDAIELREVSPINPVLTPEIFNYTLGSGNSGNIEVSARNLYLADGASVTSGTFDRGRGGNVTVNAVESIEAVGGSSVNLADTSTIESFSFQSGEGGSVAVSTRNLRAIDGGGISAPTFSSGRGGNVTVDAAESIDLVGISPFNASIASSINSLASGSADSGNISISTPNLRMRDGAQITAGTFGSGRGGDVTIEVAESIELSGVAPFNPDAISTLSIDPTTSNINSLTFGSGNGGNVRVSARNLYLADGGQISASTVASGRGGNIVLDVSESIEAVGISPLDSFSRSGITSDSLSLGSSGSVTISTGRLVLRDGGAISTNTFGLGNAGTIAIEAAEFIDIRGEVPSEGVFSAVQSAATPLPDSFGEAAELSGNSGNVILSTPRLSIADGGRVSTFNEGLGLGGTVRINAGDVAILDSNAGITASTLSGEGGNVFLNADRLQLTSQSQIGAEAGGAGNGGNIAIDADTIALLEGSSIDANAFEGRGGNIEIVTRGLFQSRDSHIAASSQLGVDGIVAVTQPEIDTSSAFVQLSSAPIDPETQVVSACETAANNTFVVTGNGGLPPDPTDVLRGHNVWIDMRQTEIRDSTRPIETPSNEETEREERAIAPLLVEATGWQRRDDGSMELVATPSPYGNARFMPLDCPPDSAQLHDRLVVEQGIQGQ